MEFLRSFLRRHLAGKPLVELPNVSCFLKLTFTSYFLCIAILKIYFSVRHKQETLKRFSYAAALITSIN